MKTGEYVFASGAIDRERNCRQIISDCTKVFTTDKQTMLHAICHGKGVDVVVKISFAFIKYMVHAGDALN